MLDSEKRTQEWIVVDPAVEELKKDIADLKELVEKQNALIEGHENELKFLQRALTIRDLEVARLREMVEIIMPVTGQCTPHRFSVTGEVAGIAEWSTRYTNDTSSALTGIREWLESR